MDFADFYALVPTDDRDPIQPGEPLLFPQDGAASGEIKRRSEAEFTLPADGTYEIRFVVAVDEPCQLVMALDTGGGPEEQSFTVVGREANATQVSGLALLTTKEAATLSIPQSTCGRRVSDPHAQRWRKRPSLRSPHRHTTALVPALRTETHAVSCLSRPSSADDRGGFLAAL